jgi:hypothetical protein
MQPMAAIRVFIIILVIIKNIPADY